MEKDVLKGGDSQIKETVHDERVEGRHNLLYKQTIANLPLLLINISVGMVAGYSAILLPQLELEEDVLHPTKNQESWIASLAPLPMAIGCIFSGLSMDRIGRRSTAIASIAISSTGWLIIHFSANINYLLAGRILTGLSVGYSGVCLSAYVGEVSHPKYRGLFLSTMALGVSLGTFVCHLLGMFFTWRDVVKFVLALQLIAVGLLLYVPESHVWYLNGQRLQQAKEAFVWFRGSDGQAKAELDRLISETVSTPKRTETLSTVWAKCKQRRFLKPFSILLMLFILSQTTGSNAVIFYSVRIMQSTVEGIDKYTSTICVDALRVAMSTAACVLIKKYRIRYLALISAIGTTTSLFALALFIQLTAKHPQNETIGKIPLICFMSYIIFVSIGLIPISWSLLGEILPPDTKGIGGGIATTVNFLMFFVVVKTNPDLVDWIGFSGTFAIYGSCTLVGTVLIYFYLPETRGKTLHDIQTFFMSRLTIMDTDDEEKVEESKRLTI